MSVWRWWQHTKPFLNKFMCFLSFCFVKSYKTAWTPDDFRQCLSKGVVRFLEVCKISPRGDDDLPIGLKFMPGEWPFRVWEQKGLRKWCRHFFFHYRSPFDRYGPIIPCFVDSHETPQKLLRIALKQRQTLLWSGLTTALAVRSEQTRYLSHRQLSHG